MITPRESRDRPQGGPLTDDEFNRQLLKSGLMTSLPIPPDEPELFFEPIVVEGEPLSETIIGERR